MSFYGVIADDLTGAMDAGMQMLDKGRIKVTISHEGFQDITDDTDFVVVNTQTRNGCSNEAYSITKDAASQLLHKGCNVIYKKIDSTLRGHIGIEIKALIDCEQFDCCIVAPALPYNNRITIDGIHIVDGVKISDTEFAKDPFAPVKDSAISSVIREKYNTHTVNLNLNLIREGSQALCEEINRQVKSGVKVLIADAVEESDLMIIAQSVRLYQGRIVLCGSAGLFKYFDFAYDIKKNNKTSYKSTGTLCDDKHVLAVSGSCANASRKQIEYASIFRDDVKVVKFDTLSLINEEFNDTRMSDTAGKMYDIRSAIAKKILYCFERGYDVALDIAEAYMYEILAHFGDNRYKLNYIRLLVSESIAELTQYVLSSKIVGALVIFGGDTAFWILKRLGVKGIEIRGEIEPYIPYGILLGGEFDSLPVVTKAGSFGKEDTLCRIFGKLRGDENDL